MPSGRDWVFDDAWEAEIQDKASQELSRNAGQPGAMKSMERTGEFENGIGQRKICRRSIVLSKSLWKPTELLRKKSWLSDYGSSSESTPHVQALHAVEVVQNQRWKERSDVYLKPAPSHA